MVTQKICPERFLTTVFDPCISRGLFFGPFFRLKGSSYTRVNTEYTVHAQV